MRMGGGMRKTGVCRDQDHSRRSAHGHPRSSPTGAGPGRYSRPSGPGCTAATRGSGKKSRGGLAGTGVPVIPRVREGNIMSAGITDLLLWILFHQPHRITGRNHSPFHCSFQAIFFRLSLCYVAVNKAG